jgi:hypothetical protein
MDPFLLNGGAVYADRTDADTDNSSDSDLLVIEPQAIDTQVAVRAADTGESRAPSR